MDKTQQLSWKVHVPRLCEELLLNPGTGILHVPLKILLRILGEVAERAIELNDDKMNALMIRLTLYSCADPLCDDYNPDTVREALKET